MFPPGPPLPLHQSIWLFCLVPVLLRRWLGAPEGRDPWRSTIDLPLMVACGVGFGLLNGFWFARFHLTGWPLTASDFAQYCGSVGSLQAGNLDRWIPQRSLAAGWLPGILSRRLGIMGALIAGALIGTGVVGSAIYLWARSAAGRLGGLVAVLAGLTVTPVVALSRTVTFYPEIVAGQALGSALVAASMRWRTLPGLLAGGTGIGLMLFIDIRSVYWGVGALPFVVLAALWPTKKHRRWFLQPFYVLPRIAVVLAPIWASHTAAHKLLFEETPGLEPQTRWWAQDALRTAGIRFQQTPNQDGLGYRWGFSPVFDAPAAILRAQEIAGQIPAHVAGTPQVAFARHAFVDPWVIPMAACAVLVLLGTRARRWRMLAALLMCVPFVAALYSASHTLAYPRYLSLGLVAAPVLIGSAVGLAAGTRWRWRVALPVLVTSVLLVTGQLPSWLSPVANWRTYMMAEDYPRTLQLNSDQPDPIDASCTRLLRKDAAAGRVWDPYRYPDPDHSSATAVRPIDRFHGGVSP